MREEKRERGEKREREKLGRQWWGKMEGKKKLEVVRNWRGDNEGKQLRVMR